MSLSQLEDTTLVRIWCFIPTVELLQVSLVCSKWSELLYAAQSLWEHRCNKNQLEVEKDRKIPRKYAKPRSKFMESYITLLKERYTAIKRCHALVHNHNRISDKIQLKTISLDDKIQLFDEKLPNDFTTSFRILENHTITLNDKNRVQFFSSSEFANKKKEIEELRGVESSTLIPFATVWDSTDVLCLDFEGNGFVMLFSTNNPLKEPKYLSESFSEFLQIALDFISSSTNNEIEDVASPESSGSAQNTFFSFFGRPHVDSFIDYVLQTSDNAFGSQIDHQGSQNFY
jgi:hypothetical protein